MISLFFKGLPPERNGPNHSDRQQPYSNQVNTHKYPPAQHSVPVQSGYIVSSAATRNGLLPSSTTNIYHFSQNNPSRGGQSKHHHHPRRQDVTVTTYL